MQKFAPPLSANFSFILPPSRVNGTDILTSAYGLIAASFILKIAAPNSADGAPPNTLTPVSANDTGAVDKMIATIKAFMVFSFAIVVRNYHIKPETVMQG